jgi:phosphatidylserine/phosphatidylglycerophosphate/cardiolipin synthase-like enzyme
VAKPVGKPFLSLRCISTGKDAADNSAPPVPKLALAFDGIPTNTTVQASLWESDGTGSGERKPDRELGKISGKISSKRDAQGCSCIKLDAPMPTQEQALAGVADADKPKAVLVCLSLATADGPTEGYFRLGDKDATTQEGDYWEITAKGTCSFAGKDHNLTSPDARIARMPRAVPRGEATYFPRAGNRLEFYNDGCKDATGTEGALKDMVDAIRDAQNFVFVADWSFHPLFRPSREGASADANVNNTIGMELIKKAKAGVTTAVLTWDHTAVIAADKQNDEGDAVLASIAKKSATSLTHEAGNDSNLGNVKDAAMAGVIAGAGVGAVLEGAKLADDHHVGGVTGKLAHGLHDVTSNEAVAAAVVGDAAIVTAIGETAVFGSDELPANLYWRKTSRAGMMGSITKSHHQKMLVMDCEEDDGRRGIRVFLGGLDLTKGRFDYSEHPVAPAPGSTTGDKTTWTYAQRWKVDGWHDKDPVDEWYNAETDGDRTLPRQPWHDVHAKLDGPAAWNYLREFVGRWLTISGGSAKEDAVWKAYLALLDRKKFWPPEEPLPDGIWTVQVCRSLEKAHWTVDLPKRTQADLEKGQHWSEGYRFNWGVAGADYEQSILQAYRRGIDVAERFVYIENQYFIGSGKHWEYADAENDIPERLVNKILERRAAGKDFHVYIVMPMFPEGNPGDSSACELRACEWETVKWMIFALSEAMGSDWEKYLSFYFLANWTDVPRAEWMTKGERNDRMRKHQRYMIYVHTKLMIVDDRHVILGSCNLNDRGLTGNTDSEIAISAWPRLKERDKCIKKVQDLRERLWREHLRGGFPEASWTQPESEGCVNAVRKKGFGNYRAFREMRRSGSEGHLCLWNYYTEGNEIKVRTSDTNLGILESDPIRGSEENMCLPDSPYISVDKAKGKGWCWYGDFRLFVPRSLVK